MIPVLSSAFELQESLVRERIDRIVEVLRVDQAAQATIADFVARLPDVAKLIPGLPRKEARPVWDAKVNAIVPGDPTVVEEKLRASLEEKLASASAKACTVSLDGLLRGFKERVEQWSDVRIESKEWLIDWSGKEVLTAAIRWLSGEFGWHMNGGKLRIDWSALNRNDAEAVEREIVTALQPRFVNRFLEHLAKRASEDVIRLEWESIRNTLH